MLRGCGVYNVANLDIPDSFVELDRTVIKGTTVAHLHKIREAKVRINMVRAIIGDLLLEDKVVKMWREGSFTLFVEDGMHRVNVGLKDKVMVVVIVGEIILRMSVVNQIKSLACPTRWPTHNNKLETT